MGSFARHHDELKNAFVDLKGCTLTTKSIKEVIGLKIPEFDENWIYPSDHCINHICKGACDCAETSNAIFERLDRGLYKVV